MFWLFFSFLSLFFLSVLHRLLLLGNIVNCHAAITSPFCLWKQSRELNCSCCWLPWKLCVWQEELQGLCTGVTVAFPHPCHQASAADSSQQRWGQHILPPDHPNLCAPQHKHGDGSSHRLWNAQWGLRWGGQHTAVMTDFSFSLISPGLSSASCWCNHMQAGFSRNRSSRKWNAGIEVSIW